jgi:hypothetical protein
MANKRHTRGFRAASVAVLVAALAVLPSVTTAGAS